MEPLNHVCISFIRHHERGFNPSHLASSEEMLQPVVNKDHLAAPIELVQTPITEKINPYQFWVNKTQLEMQPVSGYSGGPNSGPDTEFPYTRLAGTVPVNASAYYLYHQLNQTTIAEDRWSPDSGVWVSNLITVPTS